MVVLTSFTQPTDGIRHRQNNTTVYVNDNNLGKGTLYIAESRLSWVSDSGNGFSIEYPHISLHAVSRDLSAFPQECLFLMLDTALGDEETNNGDGENDDGNENGSDEETTEIRLVPDDRGMLEAMFHAMNACQALHPDPEDSFSDEDFYEDADDEIPMEETDYRMAGLRIENTDGRAHIGRGVADMEQEGMLGTSEDRAVGMGEDTWAGRAVGMAGDTWVGRGVGMAGDTWAGMAVGMEGDISGTLGGREVGTGGDIWAGREVGMAVGMGGDIWAGRGVGMGGDISGTSGRDRVGGMGGDISGTSEGDRVGGMGEDMAGDRSAEGMALDGRSLSSGNTWHQGRTALLPAAHSPHTALDLDRNFDDAEN